MASWWNGLLQLNLQLLWIVVGCAWVGLGAWLLRGGVAIWQTVPQKLRLFGGLCALWVAWLAVVQARLMGINFLFSVLVLTWAADIFAYFAGRAFGGKLVVRKLAPTLSPGKTWEGVMGGVIGVMVCAWAWRWFDGSMPALPPSLYTRLGQVGVGFSVLALLFLTMMSVIGDLMESLFKRSAGVKDSSGLLPGHGGVLDRVDALLPVLPLAMVFVSL
jgi:phosphatidate cytidylyltransferase